MTYNYSIKKFSIENLEKLKRKAKSGDGESLYLLAIYYEDGITVDNKIIIKPNRKKAFKLLKVAYENGSMSGLIHYADYLSDPNFSNYDERLSIKLYKIAIENNEGLAAFNLARLYTNKGKYNKAFEYYLLSEQLGSYCYFEISVCYYYGIGTKQNISKAIGYLRKVIKNEKWQSEYEFEEANYILGKLYLEGLYLKRSISKAIYHLEIANREKDHRSAQDILMLLG